MTLSADLKQRGLIYQQSPGADEALDAKAALYLGFDPTGDSLHVGHLLGVITLTRAVQNGNPVIVLMGSGTSMIGDPSGKDQERPVLDPEVIDQNKQKMKQQLSRFFRFDDTTVRMVDNANWLSAVSLITFLREAGKYIGVSSMLDKESVSSRLDRDTGISYAEFSYQLLQAYDFMKLYQMHECTVQIGGSDQWGNIVQGVELIRKRHQASAFALSFPLIVNPRTGKKFGKTEAGEAIWLDGQRTSPFSFYQFFLNVDDAIAPDLMRYFSLRPMTEIAEVIAQWEQAPHQRQLQRSLAAELTEIVHGRDAVEQAERVSRILFEQSDEDFSEDDRAILIQSLPHIELVAGKEIVPEQVVAELGLVESLSAGRRLAKQNGIHISEPLSGLYLVRKGKKEYGVVSVAPTSKM